MNIEIKKTEKPVNYQEAISLLEDRLKLVSENKGKELIWILEHEAVYTAGTSYSKKEILDKTIKIHETNRGGKITYHGPGQLIFYFVIDLRNRKKILENSLILLKQV
jgi:lipoyl(octanoyl) transferase